jgi:hypothetical protein
MAYSPDSFIRFLGAVIFAAAAGASFTQPERTAGADPALSRTPVLVELFTSEGCSDCPPADDLLARLDAEQFVHGVYAIVLSEHVTYWNHQGWSDPFSLPKMDSRQQQYGGLFHLDSVYTPQMVVDGASQFVGSASADLTAALKSASAARKQPLEILAARWDKEGVHFSVRSAFLGGTHLVAALAENTAHAEVSAGENAHRSLHHVAVVRTLEDFKPGFGDGRQLTLSASGVQKGKTAPLLRLVVFLVEDQTGRVRAVAQQSLNPPA